MNINIFSKSSEYDTFLKGAVIFKAGDSGDLAYAVKEGVVNILVGERVVEQVKPGGIFGEMALIDHNTRSATAVAATDCQLVPISARQFTLLVQQTPFFALEVMRLMAERLRSANECLQISPHTPA